MVNSGTGRISMKAMSHSTLWIAVLVVHVGCIIDAQPSKYSSSSSSPSPEDGERLIPAASQSAIYTNSGGKNSIYDKEMSVIIATPLHQRSAFTRGANRRSSRYPTSTSTVTSTSTSSPSPTTSTVTSTTLAPQKTDASPPDDSCSQKNDGYYQNWGSDCTSYYFCAAGYQLTYVCPPGQRFNGKRCNEDYICPLKPGYSNPCGRKPNGYYAYPGGKHPGKYFYCFQKAKVIELQCEVGKIFANGKCSAQPQPQPELVGVGDPVAIVPLDMDSPKRTMSNGSPYKLVPESKSESIVNNSSTDENCVHQSNGFYTERESSCTKYYYCINGEKTGLTCDPNFLFNGDLCVHNSRFECPTT